MASDASSLINNGLTTAGNTAGFGTTPQSITSLVGNLINAVISLTGILLIVLIVYAGYLYMMSQGEAPKVDKAKKLLAASIIGLVIMLAAYAISSYVIGALLVATSGTAA